MGHDSITNGFQEMKLFSSKKDKTTFCYGQGLQSRPHLSTCITFELETTYSFSRGNKFILTERTDGLHQHSCMIQ